MYNFARYSQFPLLRDYPILHLHQQYMIVPVSQQPHQVYQTSGFLPIWLAGNISV